VLATAKRSASESTAIALNKRLLEATTGRYVLGSQVIDYSGPSIGVIVAKKGCKDPQTLLAEAEAEMHGVKRARKERESPEVRAKP